MKRKILFIKKDIEKLLVEILSNCDSFESQVNLVKKRSQIIQTLEKIEKKYEKIIDEKQI